VINEQHQQLLWSWVISQVWRLHASSTSRAVNAINVTINEQLNHLSLSLLYAAAHRMSITDTRRPDTLITQHTYCTYQRSHISTWWRKTMNQQTSLVYFSDNSVKNRPIFISIGLHISEDHPTAVRSVKANMLVLSMHRKTVTSYQVRKRSWILNVNNREAILFASGYRIDRSHKPPKFLIVYLNRLWHRDHDRTLDYEITNMGYYYIIN